MATSNGVQQSFQQKFKCKECGLALNSAESLEVHRQYHEGNLMQQWAVKAQSSNSEEKNNNMTKQPPAIKREFSSTNSIQNDCSDNQKKSPDYQRTTPDGMYGHPPTPQSYQSVSSPYQNNDNSAFSPNFPNFPVVKSEGNSPASLQQNHYHQSFNNFSDQQQQQFYDPNSPYHGNPSDIQTTKYLQSFRYNPYGRPQSYEPSKPAVGAPASSPVYPPQPTPSPSPKQCDKCGYVCETAAELIEHNNLTHNSYNQNNQYGMFDQVIVKEEEPSQSEILDLDSQKVVHPDWADSKEDVKRPISDPGIPHSVSAMLNNWPPPSESQPVQSNGMFPGDHNMYMSQTNEPKMFPDTQMQKMYPADQKLFQQPQIDNQNFLANTVSSTVPSGTHEHGANNQPSYRAFEHISNAPNSVISRPQVPQVPPNNAPTAPTSTKSASWKSNEARRPKTYNCTACNKWFTSSGHLKRHYNTTLHKNAVKSSGQPDPATMPISAHHHPSRDSATSKEERSNSNSPREDSRGEDSNGMVSQFDNRLGSMPGLLQHPPNGPYDRQGMHHMPPMHSPLANSSHIIQNPGFTNLSNGSSPNGEAGLSQNDSRGLLISPSSHSFQMMSQPSMMPMDAAQFQTYPNGLSPHVTQAMDTTSNLNTTGEQFIVQENQPLPSFAHFQAHRFGGGYADVGGVGSATTPTASFDYYTTNGFDLSDSTKTLLMKDYEGTYYAVVSNHDVDNQAGVQDVSQFSPTESTNNNNILFNGLHNQNTTLMYVTENSQSDSQSLLEPQQSSSSSTPEHEDQKENFEENTATVSSTVQNPEVDLSKTKCFDCDKVFNRPCYLTQHNKTFHSGEKPFKCEKCGKKFGTEELFKEHAMKHESKNKQHKCDKCPKMFNHKTDLRRHNCCHTGKKPYACELCGKGFIRKDHMVKHLETHYRKKEKLSAMRS